MFILKKGRTGGLTVKIAIDFYKSWGEFMFLVLIVVGIIFAIISPSAVVSYMVIFLVGGMVGRIMYWRRESLKTAYYIAAFGFLIGFFIGTYYGSRQIVIMLFFVGMMLSYYLYDKKILHDTIF